MFFVKSMYNKKMKKNNNNNNNEYLGAHVNVARGGLLLEVGQLDVLKQGLDLDGGGQVMVGKSEVSQPQPHFFEFVHGQDTTRHVAAGGRCVEENFGLFVCQRREEH